MVYHHHHLLLFFSLILRQQEEKKMTNEYSRVLKDIEYKIEKKKERERIRIFWMY
jgi:hypothetical protein